ncbi:hypothetical protein HPB52_006345 [Rhipicephalus sanguineus]|uniref:HTH CENPB-type domain-containing protein n=1 Tax=Rhipicephalus sanguineus TaxID=34632 RepID=A0A9D4PI63_RHISA|nr:hypothetical protein HPB52_006345 [Rhipicephalus sanguineus]
MLKGQRSGRVRVETCSLSSPHRRERERDQEKNGGGGTVVRSNRSGTAGRTGSMFGAKGEACKVWSRRSGSAGRTGSMFRARGEASKSTDGPAGILAGLAALAASSNGATLAQSIGRLFRRSSLISSFAVAICTMSRKRKALSFKEKLDILKKVDEDPTRKRIDIVKKLDLAPSTLSTILGQRHEIMRNVQRFSANVKEAKRAHYVKVEEALLTWFREVTAAGVNVDGQLLREKASDIAWSLGVNCFQASSGWIHHDFVTADDDLATCGLRTIDEIVKEVAPSHPEMVSSDDDDDCSASEQPPSTAEIMHALDIMRCSVASERARESTSAQFFTFQASLMVDLAKKKVQKDIRDFFSRK